MGGMERSTLRLADDLARRGVRVLLVTTYSSATDAFGPTIERRGDLEIVRFPWPTRWHYTLAELWFYARASLWLLANAHRWSVLQGVYAPTCGALASWLAWLTRRRSLVRLACAGPPGDMAHIARHPARRFLHWLLERASAVVCPGRDVADEVLAEVPRARVLHIPNGVDTSVFKPEAHPFRSRVIAVMRFRPEKALPRLLEAWALVERAHPGATLEIAGDGPDSEKAHELARTLGLARLTFLGLRSDIPELLRGADVFIHASDAEGLSNALLEAMASGLACVATDIGPNREALGDAGVLVARTMEAIAEGLVSLLREPSRVAELGARARARALERYALDFMVERYARVYRGRLVTDVRSMPS